MVSDTRRVASKLHERAYFLRGRFLTLVSVIERNLAEILTEYFCREDADLRQRFFDRVAMKMSLNAKRDLWFEILKADHPSFWSKNEMHLLHLRSIQEFRNKLAHSVVDLSPQALTRGVEAGVGFVDWKRGEPIQDAEFEEWQVRAMMIFGLLNDHRRLLPFIEKQHSDC